MKLGLLARGDLTGLAVQTYGFYKHLQPDRTLVVDLSRHSGKKPDLSLYPDGKLWDDKVYPSLSRPSDAILEDFLNSIDVLLTCETPYNYWLFERARELGVKTALQFNYEFLDYSRNSLPEPDLFIAPSEWHIEDVQAQLPGRDIIYLPVPIDRKVFPFTHRSSLRSLLHTAGTVAMEDRNGTIIACEAMDFVNSDVSLTVRSQFPIKQIKNRSSIKKIFKKVPSSRDLYSDEDAFVFPRKFGGLCLPLNEAVSLGMPIIVPDCDPQHRWVPSELMVEASKGREIETRNTLNLFECSPRDVAAKIDELASDNTLFSEMSYWANDYADSISWDLMREKYKEILENI